MEDLIACLIIVIFTVLFWGPMLFKLVLHQWAEVKRVWRERA